MKIKILRSLALLTCGILVGGLLIPRWKPRTSTSAEQAVQENFKPEISAMQPNIAHLKEVVGSRILGGIRGEKTRESAFFGRSSSLVQRESKNCGLAIPA
jgi:hypothetical protein